VYRACAYQQVVGAFQLEHQLINSHQRTKRREDGLGVNLFKSMIVLNIVYFIDFFSHES
jgi:hypothetical protein